MLSIPDQREQLIRIFGDDWKYAVQGFVDHNEVKRRVKKRLQEIFGKANVYDVGMETLLPNEIIYWLKKQPGDEPEAIRGIGDLLVRLTDDLAFFVEIKWPDYKSPGTDIRNNLEGVQWYWNIKREHPTLYILFRQTDDSVKCVWGHQLIQHPEWDDTYAYYFKKVPSKKVLDTTSKVFGPDKKNVWYTPPHRPHSGELHIKLNEDARKFQNDILTEIENIKSNFQEIRRQFEQSRKDIDRLDS